MLYVKIMCGDDLSDTNQHKHYTIIPIQNNEVMQFIDNSDYAVWASGPADPLDRSPEPARYQLQVHGPEGGCETHDLTGNAYVMAESGKTISSHAC